MSHFHLILVKTVPLKLYLKISLGISSRASFKRFDSNKVDAFTFPNTKSFTLIYTLYDICRPSWMFYQLRSSSVSLWRLSLAFQSSLCFFQQTEQKYPIFWNWLGEGEIPIQFVNCNTLTYYYNDFFKTVFLLLIWI